MFTDTIQAVVDGFNVLIGESRWNCIRLLRRFEIRQLEKRLAEEHQTLGQSCAAALKQGETFDPTQDSNDLTLRQITFLREEIEHLEQELETLHTKYATRHQSKEEKQS